MAETRSRRGLLKGSALKGAAMVAASAGVASAQSGPAKKVYRSGPKPATPPAYSPAVSYGNLLFLSGAIYRGDDDIKVQTTAVLNDIGKQLEAAGSSMEKVLKCTVFLADKNDLAGMNEAYTGRFGGDPPARSTAVVAALPANSKIEIDVVAYI